MVPLEGMDEHGRYHCYWDPDYGCRRSQWLEAYDRERLLRRKTRRRGTPRRRLIKMWDEFSPLRCLETNCSNHKSEYYRDLSDDKRLTDIPAFILNNVKPRILFAHGKHAVDHTCWLFQHPLEPYDREHLVAFQGQKILVWPSEYHLSARGKGITDDLFCDIARNLRKSILGR